MRRALPFALALWLISAAFPSLGADLGESIYMQSRCYACHGQFGFGGAGPRLRNDRLLAADQYVIGQILMGRGIMPSFDDELSNEQIAAVATYIRTSWGNDFGPIQPEQVAKARKDFAKDLSDRD